MAKLTILRGLSGSGKTTWAEVQPNAVVVSRDTLRAILFGSDGPDYYAVDKGVLKRREDYVTKVEHEAIASALTSGIDVISDNTNIERKFVQPIAEIGFKAGADVEVKEFDVSLPVAKAQNKGRSLAGGRNVPDDVIERQYRRFQQTKGMTLEAPVGPRAYNGTPGKPKAVLVDIDGTLAHMNGKRSPFDWKNVGVDDPDKVVIDLVKRLSYDPDLRIILMSGRDSAAYEATVEWLEKHGVIYDDLFMRAKNDMRKDSIVKSELFDNYVRNNYDVQFVLDDRDQVVDMWRSMGIKCLQVAPGAF